MIERDKPAIYKYDFEGEEEIPLSEFYLETDNVIIEENKGLTVVYDLDDNFIMIQEPDKEIFLINLLYARIHANNLYENWYFYKNNRKKYNRVD